jgi:hypothetical protein
MKRTILYFNQAVYYFDITSIDFRSIIYKWKVLKLVEYH